MYSAIEMYKQQDIILNDAVKSGVLVDATSANRLFEDFFFSGDKYCASPMAVVPEGRYIMRLIKVTKDQERVPVYDPTTDETENLRVMAYLTDLSDNKRKRCFVCYNDFRFFHQCAINDNGVFEILE